MREAAGNAGLRAPYLGKPLFADGREGSHGLLVIKDEAGLQQVAKGPRPTAPSLPIVLQQYVAHGACLFKVAVLLLPPYLLRVDGAHLQAVREKRHLDMIAGF